MQPLEKIKLEILNNYSIFMILFGTNSSSIYRVIAQTFTSTNFPSELQ